MVRADPTAGMGSGYKPKKPPRPKPPAKRQLAPEVTQDKPRNNRQAQRDAQARQRADAAQRRELARQREVERARQEAEALRRRQREWVTKGQKVDAAAKRGRPPVRDLEAEKIARSAREAAAKSKAERAQAEQARRDAEATKAKEDWQWEIDQEVEKWYDNPLRVTHEIAASRSRLSAANNYFRFRSGDPRQSDRHYQIRQRETYRLRALLEFQARRRRNTSGYETSHDVMSQDPHLQPRNREKLTRAQAPIKTRTDLWNAHISLKMWAKEGDEGQPLVPRQYVDMLMGQIDSYVRGRSIEVTRLGDKLEKLIDKGDADGVRRLLEQNEDLLSEYKWLFGEGNSTDKGEVERISDAYNDYAERYNQRVSQRALRTMQGLYPVGDGRQRTRDMQVERARAEWKASGTRLSFEDWLGEEDKKNRLTLKQLETTQSAALDTLNRTAGRQLGVTYTMGVDADGNLTIQTEVDRSNPNSEAWVSVERGMKELEFDQRSLANPDNLEDLMQWVERDWMSRNPMPNARPSSSSGPQAGFRPELEAGMPDYWKKRAAYMERARLIFGWNPRNGFLDGLGKSPVGWAWDALQGAWTAGSTSVKDWAWREGGELDFMVPEAIPGMDKERWNEEYAKAQRGEITWSQFADFIKQPAYTYRTGVNRSPEARARAQAERDAYLQALADAKDDPQKRLQAWNNFGARMFSEESVLGNLTVPFLLDPSNWIPLNVFSYLRRGQHALAATKGSNALAAGPKFAWNWLTVSGRELGATANTKRVLRQVGATARPEEVLAAFRREAVGMDDASAVTKWLQKHSDEELRAIVGAPPGRDLGQLRRLAEDVMYRELERRRIPVLERAKEMAKTERAKAAAKRAEAADGTKAKATRDRLRAARREAEGKGAVKDFAERVREPLPKPKPKSAKDRLKGKGAKAAPSPEPVAPLASPPKPNRAARRRQPSHKDPWTGEAVTAERLKRSIKADATPEQVRSVQRRFGYDDNWEPLAKDPPVLRSLDEVAESPAGFGIKKVDSGKPVTRRPRAAAQPKQLPEKAARAVAGRQTTRRHAVITQDVTAATRERMLKDGDAHVTVAKMSKGDHEELLKDPNYVAATADPTDVAAGMIVRELYDKHYAAKRSLREDGGGRLPRDPMDSRIRSGAHSAAEGEKAARFAEALRKMREQAHLAKTDKGEGLRRVLGEIEKETQNWAAERDLNQLAAVLKELSEEAPSFVSIPYRSFGDGLIEFTGEFRKLVDKPMAKLKDGWDTRAFLKLFTQVDSLVHGFSEMGVLKGPLGYAIGGQYLFELFHTWRLAGKLDDILKAHHFVLKRIEDTAGTRSLTSEYLADAMWLVMEARAGKQIPFALDRPVAERLFKEAADDLGMNPYLALAAIPFGVKGGAMALRTRVGKLLTTLERRAGPDAVGADAALMRRLQPDDYFTGSEDELAAEVTGLLKGTYDHAGATKLAWKMMQWVADRHGTFRKQGAPTLLRARLYDFVGWHAIQHMGDEFPESIVLQAAKRKQAAAEVAAGGRVTLTPDRELLRMQNGLRTLQRARPRSGAVFPRVPWELREAWMQAYFRRPGAQVVVRRTKAGVAPKFGTWKSEVSGKVRAVEVGEEARDLDLSIKADAPWITHDNANAHIVAYFAVLQDADYNQWAGLSRAFVRHMTVGAGRSMEEARDIIRLLHPERLDAARSRAIDLLQNNAKRDIADLDDPLRLLNDLDMLPTHAEAVAARKSIRQAKMNAKIAEKQAKELSGERQAQDFYADGSGFSARVTQKVNDIEGKNYEWLAAEKPDAYEGLVVGTAHLVREAMGTLVGASDEARAAADSLIRALRKHPKFRRDVVREALDGLSDAERAAYRKLVSGAKPGPSVVRASGKPRSTPTPIRDLPEPARSEELARLKGAEPELVAPRTEPEAVADVAVEVVAKVTGPVDLREALEARHRLIVLRRTLTKGTPEWTEVTDRLRIAARVVTYLTPPKAPTLRAIRARRRFVKGVVSRLGDKVKDLIPSGKVAWYVEDPAMAVVERVRDLQAQRLAAVVKGSAPRGAFKTSIDKLMASKGGRMYYDEVDEVVSAAIRKVQGKRRALLDRRGPPKGGDRPGGLPRVDADSLVVRRARNKALRDLGIEPGAYLAVRNVLRRGLVKERSTRRLAQDAMARAAASGRAYNDEFIEARKALAENEAVAQLEWVASVDMMGMSDEDIFKHLEDAWTPDKWVRGERDVEWTAVDAYIADEAVRTMTGGIDIMDDSAMALYLGQNRPVNLGWSRESLHRFLRDFGYWRPRELRDFAEGASHWTWREQLEFFRRNYRFTPEYLDVEFLRREGYFTSLSDFVRLSRRFGDINDEAAIQRRLLGMTHKEFEEAVRRGDPSIGLHATRTRQQERDFWIGLWGDEVLDEAGNLKAMPWLWNADEIRAHTPKAISPFRARTSSLIASQDEVDAYERVVRVVMDDMEKKGRSPFLNPAGVRSEDVTAFAAEVARQLAGDTDWLEFLARRGALSRGLGWMGDVQRFTVMSAISFAGINFLDTVAKSLAFLSDGGRSVFKGTQHDRAGAVLRSIHDLDPLAESGFQRAFREKPWRRLATADRKATRVWRDRAASWVGVLRDFSPSLLGRLEEWGRLKVGRQVFAQVWDSQRALIKADMEARLGRKLLAAEEDQVDALADLAARAAARREVNRLYPNLSRASYAERVLNDMSPFFSYMLKNQIVWISEVLEHPAWVNRVTALQRWLEQESRAKWEREHPEGEPMPEELKHMIELPWAPGAYLDLSQFSDATRGLRLLGGKRYPVKDWLYKTFRWLPPSTVAFMHMITDAFGWTGRWMWRRVLDENGVWDGESRERVWVPDGEPWSGQPVTLGSLLWPFDIANFVNELSQEGTTATEFTRIIHKFLFYGDMTTLDPRTVQEDMYFALRDKNEAKARQYLADHPELLAYWAEKRLIPRDFLVPRALDPDKPNFMTNPDITRAQRLTGSDWLREQPYEFRVKVGRGYAGLNELKAGFQARLDKAILAGDWEQAREVRKERQIAVLAYYRDHPELAEYEVYSKGPDEWAEQMDDWKLDDLTDGYFALLDKKPVQKEGETSEAFRLRKQEWRDQLNGYIAVYPQVRERVRNSVEAVAAARDFQQSLWQGAFNRFGKYGVALDAAKAAGDYDLQDAIYLAKEVDAAIHGTEVSLFIQPGDLGRTSRSIGSLVLPDFTRLRLNSMNEAEKARYYKDKYYGTEIKKVIEAAKINGKWNDEKSPGRFVKLMKDNPELLAMYFAKNPGKEQEWAANEEYIRRIGRFGRLAKAGRLDAAFEYFDRLPPWIKQRYFEKHPEFKQSLRYVAHMQRWTRFFDRNDPQGAMDYFWSMPAWVRERYFKKHPGKRDSWGRTSDYASWMGRWIKKIDGGNWDESNAFFWSMPAWVRQRYFRTHPNSGMRKTKDGAFGSGGGMSNDRFKEYGRYMKGWVELIEEGDWDKSNDYFWSLPKWVRDQYFKNNPDSGMRKTKGGKPGGGKPTFTPSGDDRAYIDAMGRFVEFYRNGDEAGAEAFFRTLPAWMRNRYLAKHPDKFMIGVEMEMQVKLAEYFNGDEAHRALYLSQHPEVAAFLDQNDGASQRVSILLAIYKQLPEDEWIRRNFREMYPDVFSAEAREKRRAEAKWAEAAELGLTDEMAAWLEALATSAREASKWSIRPPKPVEFVHERRRRKHSNTYSALDLARMG